MCINHQSAQKYSEIIDKKLNSIVKRLVVAELFNCEFTKRFPTQFIRSNGIDCTKYSRCSFCIKHIGRFFCVISSSRSLSDCNNSGNQIRSHEHINGLSNSYTRKKIKFINLICFVRIAIIILLICAINWVMTDKNGEK